MQVSFQVDYPDHPLNRTTTLLRPLVAVPILVVLAAVSGGSTTWRSGDTSTTVAAAGGLLMVPPLLMILFREKYPRWWFDWNVALWRFQNRVFAYVLLLRDEYPSTEEEQAVHLEVPYPDVHRDLNRWMPLVKWFLAIPHVIALVFLWIGVVFAVFAAWISILFTGRYPPAIFDFVVGVMRWQNRVIAYAITLVTDDYPPFSLRA